MMDQLALFPTRRAYLGPAEHFTTTGIGTAGWAGAGQFYYDLRRWVDGHEPEIVDEPPKRRNDAMVLTAEQVEYFRTGGR